MDIENLKIRNYRSIKNIEFEFNKSLNVFVGINGSGKTTILDSLIIPLSWLINRIQREKVSGKHIQENDIRNNESYSVIQTFVKTQDSIFKWKLVKTRKTETIKEKSELSEVTELAGFFRKQLKKSGKLPVIAYYPVNRVVKDIRPEISSKDNFYVLDVYENAIGVKANFQSFFEWFRLQEDIQNENLGSRTKWMMRNKKWLKEEVLELLENLQKISIGGEINAIEVEHIIRRIQMNEIFVESPHYLFQEILFLLKSIKRTANKKFPNIMFMEHINLAINDIENIIELFSNGYNYTDLENLTSNIIDKYNILAFKYLFLTIVKFVLLLEFWWMSNSGKNKLENLFNKYISQLKNKSENRKILFFNDIEQIVRNDANRQDVATKNEGREIQIVTGAIENFIEGYSNLRIKRTPHPHMLVDKNGETFNLKQLSDGERNLIALVGDIARRLSIANPNIKEPLKGDGIILIDEVDLHLHPSWQRLVIPKLTELFPNCQFFITTHSPQVLSHVKPESIFLLKNENNELSWSKPTESYGMSIDRVIELIMNEEVRPNDVAEKLEIIFEYIERNKLDKAKENIADLKKYLRTDPEILRAEMLIRQKELLK